MALRPSPASAAATTTLHFYSVQQTFTATDAAGQPITGNTNLPVGARYDTTDLNYVGNHTHHVSNFSASDHIACTVTSDTTQTCNDQFAIGGSLLLGNDITVTQNTPTTASGQINAGTGKYKNAGDVRDGTQFSTMPSTSRSRSPARS